MKSQTEGGGSVKTYSAWRNTVAYLQDMTMRVDTVAELLQKVSGIAGSANYFKQLHQKVIDDAELMERKKQQQEGSGDEGSDSGDGAETGTGTQEEGGGKDGETEKGGTDTGGNTETGTTKQEGSTGAPGATGGKGSTTKDSGTTTSGGKKKKKGGQKTDTASA